MNTLLIKAKNALDHSQLFLIVCARSVPAKDCWITVELEYDLPEENLYPIWLDKVDRCITNGKVIKDRNGNFENVTI